MQDFYIDKNQIVRLIFVEYGLDSVVLLGKSKETGTYVLRTGRKYPFSYLGFNDEFLLNTTANSISRTLRDRKTEILETIKTQPNKLVVVSTTTHSVVPLPPDIQ